ncbi:hypothetical protein B0H11DRAFT_2007589 [Mycena galericulata]|nr:hypothetical protein B0H11DRAFT_2007589 [Mycena galericulata]
MYAMHWRQVCAYEVRFTFAHWAGRLFFWRACMQSYPFFASLASTPKMNRIRRNSGTTNAAHRPCPRALGYSAFCFCDGFNSVSILSPLVLFTVSRPISGCFILLSSRSSAKEDFCRPRTHRFTECRALSRRVRALRASFGAHTLPSAQYASASPQGWLPSLLCALYTFRISQFLIPRLLS